MKTPPLLELTSPERHVRLAAALLIALSCIASPRSVDAGACAGPWFHPVVLSRRPPRDGGVVVGVTDGGGPSLVAAGSAPPWTTLALSATDGGDAALAFTREELAPGLWRYVPDRPLDGTLEVATDASDAPIVLPTAARSPRLRAPRLRAMASDDLAGSVAVLATAPPRGVIAAIVRRYDSPEAATSRAISWVHLNGIPGRRIALPTEGGRCRPLPPGFEPLFLGALQPRFEIVLVGEGGALSPPSNAVTAEAP